MKYSGIRIKKKKSSKPKGKRLGGCWGDMYSAKKLGWLGLAEMLLVAPLYHLIRDVTVNPVITAPTGPRPPQSEPASSSVPEKSAHRRAPALHTGVPQLADAQGAIRGLREPLGFLLPAHLGTQINAKCYSRLNAACQLLSLRYHALPENILSEDSQALRE